LLPSFGDPLTARIVEFLLEVGFDIRCGAIGVPTFLAAYPHMLKWLRDE
jgi:hypothetical protein